MIQTFKQWQDHEARILLAETRDPDDPADSDITLELCRQCRPVSMWLKENVLPNLSDELPLAVCRSLVANGISLAHMQKHHSAKLPRYVDIETGKLLAVGLH